VDWHVGGRLVRTCSWDGARGEAILDRRRIAARRLTFIVKADHLADEGAVEPDWSGFHQEHEGFRDASSATYDAIEACIFGASEEDRRATLVRVQEHNSERIAELTPLSRETWTTFVETVHESCPSLREADLAKLGEIMANLERSQAGYDLIERLAQYGPDELDGLNQLLTEWTLDMAEVVLDEIAQRLRLIETLEVRTNSPATLEVQDLQPLFEAALWIFGPEFETIEYTSNIGMVRVIRELLDVEDIGASTNRPDFVVLPNSTVSAYSCPDYDTSGEESGGARLVVIELKRPGIQIGEEEKSQRWKYVKELYERGHLVRGNARAICFLLGDRMDELESSPRQEFEGTVEITPHLFATVISRAKSRMLKLHERVKEEPCLQQHREELQAFVDPPPLPGTQAKDLNR